MILGLARAASLRLIVEPEAWSQLALLKVSSSVLGLMASSVLAALYRATFERPSPVWRAAVVGGPIIAAAGWFFAEGLMMRPLLVGVAPTVEWARLPFAMVSSTLLLYGWTGLYLAVRFAQQAERRAQEALAAEGAAHRAQWLALHYQLNPHFLFNALTASRGLIASAPDRARDVIAQLAAFLRYALDTHPEEWVTLADELKAIKNFAAIDKARFAERVRFDFDVDPTAVGIRVPPLFMIPIVENATKHGDPGPDDVLHVEITIAAIAEGVRIAVANTGTLERSSERRPDAPGPPLLPSAQIGLANVDARLDTAFPGRYQRRLYEDDGRVINELTLIGERGPR